jgi:putative glycosyl hydrolase-like family 6 (GHL6) protein
MHNLRFRQVHLDFHTSPAIEGIGEAFDKKAWQEALERGHVDSITCFAIGHHGWHYHDTQVGERHPHLKFDLLRAQFDACKEMDVNVPIYLTAGISNRVAEKYPEWREVVADGSYGSWTSSPLKAGFKSLCFNTPYLDYLCESIRETVHLFPNCDGIFLDIINQSPCCCPACLRTMEKQGLDAAKEEDRAACARMVLDEYYVKTTAAARHENPDMPVFHNSGHIARGDRDVLEHFSHLELESLPTGGWGYDHFPVSAKYCANLDLDFLGMTGRFHTTWGEFGGYKHPNALRYECAAMLAYGAKCSVGDQLHPGAHMDPTTYDLIGQAYAEVEQKEPWCTGTVNVADIGLLSSDAFNAKNGHQNQGHADVGAARILLEGHYLFDVIDGEMDFEKYKCLILPDDIAVEGALLAKLDAFLAGGGKLFLTGTSGLGPDGFVFDVGASWKGPSEFQPDYVAPQTDLSPSFLRSPMAMYLPSQRITAESGESLGVVHAPYFNRDFRHFCSHQHAPARPEPSGYDCGVLKGNILYLAHPVFSIYCGTGAVANKHYVLKALDLLLQNDNGLQTNLPSTARVSLMEQPGESRYVLHLLYANTINRGQAMNMSPEGYVYDTKPVEVIEELLPLRDTSLALRLAKKVKQATLEPGGTNIPFEIQDGVVRLTIDSFTCHQMVALSY